MNTLYKICLTLIIIGAINWGMIGIFGVNLVELLFGKESFLTNFVYSLVGISGLVSVVNVILFWVGVSILMHAFPSTGDAQALYQSVLKNSDVPIIAKILVAPFIGLIYVGAFGSVFWLDLVYAVAVAMLVPRIFLLFL